jgi:hypothetical protein
MPKSEAPKTRRSTEKGRLEKTSYRGVYNRINGEGKVTGYTIKPRFATYVGKSETFSRLTDARTQMERIRTEVKDGRLRGHGRTTVLEAIEKYRAEELPLLAVTERRNRRRHLDWWAERRGTELLTELTGQCPAEGRDELEVFFDQGQKVRAQPPRLNMPQSLLEQVGQPSELAHHGVVRPRNPRNGDQPMDRKRPGKNVSWKPQTIGALM